VSFLLKKILGWLLMPLPLVLLLGLAALFAYRRGARRAGMILAGTASTLLVAFSLPITAHYLVSPLERSFPMYDGTPVEFVIVLGGHHSSDEWAPITSLLSSTSMVRLSEGIRIYRANPGSRLLLGGYNGGDDISQAEAMARVAESLGVPRRDMELRPQARDTDDEARLWSEFTQGRPTALVSSAVHLPRALRLFARYGQQPVPGPTEFMAGSRFDNRWRDWLPSEWALYYVQRAWHEYLGIAWSELMLWLSAPESRS
jgi:uncharacterized SAM-binding protein YcdF (DUF218 family)